MTAADIAFSELLMANVADAVLFEEDEPVRTVTACHAINCRCLEWVAGRKIGRDPAASCLCTHTYTSHTPRKPGRKTKR